MVREIVRAEHAHAARRAEQRSRRRGYPSPVAKELSARRVREKYVQAVRRVQGRYCERLTVPTRSVRGGACRALSVLS